MSNMIFCSNCGIELNENDNFCPACGHQAPPSKKLNYGESPPPQTYNKRPEKYYRSRDDKVIAGVCGGLAKYFNVDPTLVRVGFFLFSLIYGVGVLVYILLAIIVPYEPIS